MHRGDELFDPLSIAIKPAGWPGVMMKWDMRRLEPANLLTSARVDAICSLVRNQSSGTSEGAPLSAAIFVSLSRNSSLM